jgi:hypothetical protein
VWQFLEGARSPWTRWACLLLAAWFPSQIYFAAVFPMSLTIAAMLGSIFFAVVKPRPIPAAILGIVAGASYVSGIVLAPALLLTSLVCQKGRQRVAAIVGGVGAIAGLAVVPLYAQAAIGRWNDAAGHGGGVDPAGDWRAGIDRQHGAERDVCRCRGALAAQAPGVPARTGYHRCGVRRMAHGRALLPEQAFLTRRPAQFGRVLSQTV